MNRIEYDEHADALYVYFSSKKVYHSLELSPRLAVDLTENGQPVGVEILDASEQLSEWLGHSVSKTKIKNALECQMRQTDTLYLQFELDDEKATLALPMNYVSPVLALG